VTPWIDPPRRRDTVAIPTVWLAVLLSLLIHGIALFITLRTVHPITASEPNENERTSSLAVQLAPESEKRAPPAATPPPSPPPTVALAPRRSGRRPAASRHGRPRHAASARPRSAADRGTPTIPVAPRVEPVPAPTAPRETPAPRPVEGDLASYVEARRRERGEVTSATSAPPRRRAARDRTASASTARWRPTSASTRRRRSATTRATPAACSRSSASSTTPRTSTSSASTRRSIATPSRRSRCDGGNASDIRVAVVRKMIEIIRDEVSGDFTWMSRRGGIATLSARPADNAQLEAYILHDIFPEYRGAP
jgi:hypothetical protein